MSDDDKPADDRPREPAWVSKLARLSSDASAKKQRDERQRGSHGAASEGRSVAQWACACGWSGGVRDLKTDQKTFALQCPQCGESKGLRAIAGDASG